MKTRRARAFYLSDDECTFMRMIARNLRFDECKVCETIDKEIKKYKKELKTLTKIRRKLR